MSEITLKNVCKCYDGGKYAVKDFNLTIHDKEFVVFVGPSGCGKSTTLRMIAGLEEISDGELWVDDELYNFRAPKERDMSMVFQDYALYPYMTVYENLAFSLQVRKKSKQEIKETVTKVAKILEIEPLLKRRPKELSGGQKQRVAIGSAIVRKSKALLMDEPLSNLDAKLRAQMRSELSNIHRELDATIVYVTHDQVEAMTLGTKLVVMKDGIVQQIAPPKDIYEHPANVFVAGFIGSPAMNFFEGYVGKRNDEVVLHLGIRRSEQLIYLSGKRAEALRWNKLGEKVIIGIRPEAFYTYDAAKKGGFEKGSSGIQVTITAQEELGAERILYFEEQNQTCSARLKDPVETKAGDTISLYVNPKQVQIFDEQTQKNLFPREVLE